MRLRQRYPYRTRIWAWGEIFETAAATVCLVIFITFCLVGLPAALPNGLADLAAHIHLVARP